MFRDSAELYEMDFAPKIYERACCLLQGMATPPADNEVTRPHGRNNGSTNKRVLGSHGAPIHSVRHGHY